MLRFTNGGIWLQIRWPGPVQVLKPSQPCSASVPAVWRQGHSGRWPARLHKRLVLLGLPGSPGSACPTNHIYIKLNIPQLSNSYHIISISNSKDTETLFQTPPPLHFSYTTGCLENYFTIFLFAQVFIVSLYFPIRENLCVNFNAYIVKQVFMILVAFTIKIL